MSVPINNGKTATQVMQEAVDKQKWERQKALEAAARQAQQPVQVLIKRQTLLADPARATELNSVTKLQELVPIRVATSRVLEGPWSGRELTAVRVIGSLFGGKHFILQLGHMLRVGETDTFRVVFVAHMPVKGDLKDPLLVADAERTGLAFMHMINMQRMDTPEPTTSDSTRIDKVDRAIMAGDTLVGKRADLLIIDEVSPHPGIPGKPPKR